MVISNIFYKDPSAKLDYLFDWRAKTNQSSEDPEITDWLEPGEIITSATVIGASGLILSSSALVYDATAVQVWLMDGSAYFDYAVDCLINTSGSRIDQRRIIIKVIDR